MKANAVALFVVAAMVNAAFWSNSASALGPLDLEVAVKAGGGSNWTGQSPNPMGFGIGGRAGVAIHGLYGGVNGMYYVGSSATGNCVPFPPCFPSGREFTYSLHSYQYGAELGYGAMISLLTVRAQVGLGDYGLVSHVETVSQTTNSYFYLEPALVGLVSLGTWLIGADVGALLLPSGLDPRGVTSSKFDSAFVAHGQVGVRF
jgi:hypothetical protein